VLLNITFGTEEILMDEIMEITDHIQEAAGQTAEVIWGYGTDDNLGEDLCVTVIATGFDAATLDNTQRASGPKKVWLDEQQDTPEANVPPVVPSPEAEPFIKADEVTDSIDKNKWDVTAPQKDLFAPSDETVESSIPSAEVQAELPQDSLTHREVEVTEEVTEPTAHAETPDVNEESVSTNDEFIIYNLDDVPEPEDLTPQAPAAESKTQETEAPQPAASQPSVQPSREAFAERQRQITRSLAEFKSKLNLPGRIADLENEPAYKRRNISIDDTPQSSESQVSRMRVNEEFDEEGNRRFELKNDNPFLHDNVD